MRRVVVTGLGAVSPLGCGVDHIWQRLTKGESGIKPIQGFDVSDLPSKIAGIGPVGESEHGHFNIDDHVDRKEQKKMDTFIAYAMAAADEAVKDSGWHPTEEEDQDVTGVMIGSGIGGLEGISEGTLTVLDRGPRQQNSEEDNIDV